MAVPCGVLPGALLCAEMETWHGPARMALLERVLVLCWLGPALGK